MLSPLTLAMIGFSIAAIASWQRTSPVNVDQFRCGSFIGVGSPVE